MTAGTPKTLHTTIRYRFADGSVGAFKGKRCYHLANSWWDAKGKAEVECRNRGEAYSEDNILPKAFKDPEMARLEAEKSGLVFGLSSIFTDTYYIGSMWDMDTFGVNNVVLPR